MILNVEFWILDWGGIYRAEARGRPQGSGRVGAGKVDGGGATLSK